MLIQAVLFTSVLVIALIDRYRHRFIVFALLALPSTIAHELMHFIVAFLLGGRPSGIHLWPKKQGGYYALGHVVIQRSTWFNLGPICLAPLLLIPISWQLLHYVPVRLSWSEVIQWGWLLGSLLYGSLPSGTDWKLAWDEPFVTSIIVILLIYSAKVNLGI